MNKYYSRKFIVTLLVIAATSVLAYYGKMGEGVAMVFSAAIASYNVMQGLIDKNV